jgi:hypothetical protein
VTAESGTGVVHQVRNMLNIFQERFLNKEKFITLNIKKLGLPSPFWIDVRGLE